MLELRHYPDPVLTTPAKPVTEFDARLRRFVDDMFETMYLERGVGLAAPQVGVSKRIFVVNCEWDEKGADGEIALINPEIVETRETYIDEEGCLSFPNVRADVERAHWVRIRYQDVDGKTREHIGEGLLARAFQHELDHLDGKVFVSYLRPEQLASVRRELDALKRDWKRRQRQQV